MRKVYLLLMDTQDDDVGRTVEGVFATVQAAADAVADQVFTELEDAQAAEAARDLDAWEEEDPVTLVFQHGLIGPGTTWWIERHEVAGEAPTPRDQRETLVDLNIGDMDMQDLGGGNFNAVPRRRHDDTDG